MLLAGFSWRRLLFPGVRFGSPAPLNSTTLSLCRFPGLVDDKEKTNGSMMSCAEVGVDEDSSKSPTRSRTRLPMFFLFSMPVFISAFVVVLFLSSPNLAAGGGGAAGADGPVHGGQGGLVGVDGGHVPWSAPAPSEDGSIPLYHGTASKDRARASFPIFISFSSSHS